jgi:hypothetical protein
VRASITTALRGGQTRGQVYGAGACLSRSWTRSASSWSAVVWGSQPSHRRYGLHRGRSCSPWHGQRVERLVSASHGCDPRLMRTPLTNRDKNHCFPGEIISHDIWLYFRFCLSYRDVEELLFNHAVSGTGSRLSFMTKTRFHMTRAAC